MKTPLRSVGASLTAALLVSTAALAVVGPSPSLAAAEVAPLPLPTFADMAVDDAHGHLFLTAGAGQDGILVTDLAGTVVTSIGGQQGAKGLALSPDGTRLYAALADAHAVSEIDTATLTETRRFATGDKACPDDLAVQATRVWFTYDCPSEWKGLGSVDLSADPATVRTDHVTGLATPQTVSLGGGRLALGSTQTPARLRSYAVDAGEVTPLATSAESDWAYHDLQVTGDGTQVVVAQGSKHFTVLDTGDLSVDRVLDAPGFPMAVTASSDGFVAGGTDNAVGAQDVWVYRGAETGAMRTFDFGSDPNGIRFGYGGLAFTADRSRLYAVTGDYDRQSPVLRVFHDPTKYLTHITVSAPATKPRGRPVTVTGQLVVENGTVTAPVTLHVTRTDRDGTHRLPDVTTASDGGFSFTETPPEGGPSTYTVSFGGDASRLPSTGSATTLVPTKAWDVDGDDIADLPTGSPGEDRGPVGDAGALTVLDSTSKGVTAEGAELLNQDSPGMNEVAQGGDRFGSSSASGDFNADGYADVAVSAPFEDAGPYGEAPDSGLVHILYGSATGLTTAGSQVIDESDPNTAGRYEFGASLATGDFDKDGCADLVVGAPGDGGGVLYVYRGSTSGLVDYSQRFSQAYSTSETEHLGERFGQSLAVGDADGDGVDDLAVGVPQDQQDRAYATGGVLVMYGAGSGSPARIFGASQLWSKASTGVPGAPAPYAGDLPDSFGQRLAFGDYDADGFEDLAVAAPGAPVKTRAGRREDAGTVTVLHGSATGLVPAEQVTQKSRGVPDKPETGDRFGTALAAGNTGKGRAAELAVTSAGDRSVTVLTGSSGRLGSAADHVWTQATPGVPGADEAEDRFGESLRFARFNGRRPSSLAIGIPGENAGRGALLLLYTDGTGLATTNARAFTQDTKGVPDTGEAGDGFGSLD